MSNNFFIAATVAACLSCGACGPESRPAELSDSRAAQLGIPPETAIELIGWRAIGDLDHDIAQFRSVFWDPADTVSLRQKIHERPLRGLSVLEIGTGSGLISLCCLQAGAERVVATDVNPVAVANAAYNAEVLQFGDRFEVRFVSTADQAAYSVIEDGESFDLIISNPPWEDGRPEKMLDYAFYDENFALLRSLLAGAGQHLKPGGRIWLAYGCVEAIRTAQQLAPEHGLQLTILDERNLDELDNLFLPGMLLELQVATDEQRTE